MPEDTKEYIAAVSKKIAKVRDKYPLQPIVFAGSGLSRRWIETPSWFELLEWTVENCPEIDKPIQFFAQQEVDYPAVATRISNMYQSWAWGAGKEQFPKMLFDTNVPSDIYLKHAVCQYIKEFGTKVKQKYKQEESAFCSIRPHAVITTNYDQLIETSLPDYQPVLGDSLLSSPFASIGEVYKIHGSVDKPSSLVLTSEDYNRFAIKRKYLTAKLLTFFVEHPIVFVGYSLEDENIKRILSDLDEAIEISSGVIPNIFFLTRPSSSEPAQEKMIEVAPSKGVRINAIEASDFQWVFEAFAHNAPLSNVNPQILRSLLARSYQLVRSDIPKQMMEVDFELIASTLETNEDFAKLFGIATLQPATEFSAQYQFSLTEVGKQLGFAGWHGANSLIKQVEQETGFDIKASDNAYHCTVKISPKSKAQMYSIAAVELLTKVKNGEHYEIENND